MKVGFVIEFKESIDYWNGRVGMMEPICIGLEKRIKSRNLKYGQQIRKSRKALDV